MLRWGWKRPEVMVPSGKKRVRGEDAYSGCKRRVAVDDLEALREGDGEDEKHASNKEYVPETSPW